MEAGAQAHSTPSLNPQFWNPVQTRKTQLIPTKTSNSRSSQHVASSQRGSDPYASFRKITSLLPVGRPNRLIAFFILWIILLFYDLSLRSSHNAVSKTLATKERALTNVKKELDAKNEELRAIQSAHLSLSDANMRLVESVKGIITPHAIAISLGKPEDPQASSSDMRETVVTRADPPKPQMQEGKFDQIKRKTAEARPDSAKRGKRQRQGDSRSSKRGSSPVRDVTVYIEDFKKQNDIYGGQRALWEKQAESTCSLSGGAKCVFMHDRSRRGEADAILYDRFFLADDLARAKDRIVREYPEQALFMLNHEPEIEKFWTDPLITELWDYKIGYHINSDVVHLYGCDPPVIQDLAGGIVAGSGHKKDDKPRENRVAAFISNCNANNDRLKWLTGLMDYFPVDSYGTCENNVKKLSSSLKRSSPTWQTSKKNLLKQYKFAIAFENSYLPGYVSEKIYDAYEAGALPIWLGTPDVDKVVPGPKSYIDTADFENPKQLAKHLLMITKNQTLYNSYFQWNEAELQRLSKKACEKPVYCRICEKALEHRDENNEQ